MNLTELEKVVEQLKRYDLIKEIENIEVWLSKLNARQINNLISLNIELSEVLIKHKEILLSLLDSKYYIHDIILINDLTYKLWFPFLLSVAKDINSLESEHHEKDMELIANTKNYTIAECLTYVAKDIISLKSGHHEKDMEFIIQLEELICILAQSGRSINQIVKKVLENTHKEESTQIEDIQKELSLNNEEIVEKILESATKYAKGNIEEELPEEVFEIRKKIKKFLS